MTTDRDPQDATTLVTALAEWLASHRGVGSSWGTDEADIALETVLLQQGVIAPDEAVSFDFDEDDSGVLRVTLEDGEIFGIALHDGSVC